MSKLMKKAIRYVQTGPNYGNHRYKKNIDLKLLNVKNKNYIEILEE